MSKAANPQCVRCGHVADWHRLDDASGKSPGDPDAEFRCLGFDPAAGGPPQRRCGCPDFVVPADAGWPYNDAPEPA